MENSTELQKPKVEADIYEKKKKYLQSLIGFHSAIKINN